jgi:nucleoside-diphosphate-sugar epimerase
VKKILHEKKFLVTGSTGRLGKEICHRLEELNATVIPIVLEGYPELPKRIEWNSITQPKNIYSKEDLEKIEVPDYVINLHWQVNRSKSFTDQLNYEIDSNIYKHTFFWNWLKEVQPRKFINISTIKIFSELNQNPVTSVSIPEPLTPYGIAKVTAEKYFTAVFHKSMTEVIHLRLGSVSSYGEVPTQLLTQLFNSIFTKKKIIINKGHISNILYIGEVIDLIINSALLDEKENYLVVGDSYLNEFISKRFEEIAKGKLNAEYVDLYPSTVDSIFISDRDKLKSSWTRSYSLDSMIELIIKSNLESSSTINTTN